MHEAPDQICFGLLMIKNFVYLHSFRVFPIMIVLSDFEMKPRFYTSKKHFSRFNCSSTWTKAKFFVSVRLKSVHSVKF